MGFLFLGSWSLANDGNQDSMNQPLNISVWDRFSIGERAAAKRGESAAVNTTVFQGEAELGELGGMKPLPRTHVL